MYIIKILIWIQKINLMNKKENNCLVYLNLSDEFLSIFKKKINKILYFDQVYWSSWKKYDDSKLDYVSIPSLIEVDKYIMEFINGYKISDYKIYKQIFLVLKAKNFFTLGHASPSTISNYLPPPFA